MGLNSEGRGKIWTPAFLRMEALDVKNVSDGDDLFSEYFDLSPWRSFVAVVDTTIVGAVSAGTLALALQMVDEVKAEIEMLDVVTAIDISGASVRAYCVFGQSEVTDYAVNGTIGTNLAARIGGGWNTARLRLDVTAASDAATSALTKIALFGRR